MSSRKCWPTIRRLRKGKQSSTNNVYSGGGELLTSTGDIVGRWKEYFEDLLNPTDTSSIEEAEAGDSEVDSVPQVSGCCGAVLADTSLQHRVAVGDSASGLADRGGGPPI